MSVGWSYSYLWRDALPQKSFESLPRKIGVEPQERFQPDEDKGTCILCRQCVEVCEQVVGVSAIGFLNSRRRIKTVGTPFMEPSGVCIGCGACAYVCPTGHIEMTENEAGNERTIWGKSFKMVACKVCGRYFAPQEQLEYISTKTGVSLDTLYTCVDCR